MAHVETVFELPEVLGQMLGGNMNVRALDAVLKPRPEAFSGVDMVNTINPLIGGVVDGAVLVTEPRDLGIGRKLVRADRRAGLNVGQDMPLQGLALCWQARHSIIWWTKTTIGYCADGVKRTKSCYFR